jgi:DNA-directed RNA polymerase specialized sigma24 family protein
VRRLLEKAIDALPEPFRVVYILREIEECSVEDTALALDLKPETVKTRLFRARRQLREALHDQLANTLGEAFPFLGARCDRITEAVIARIGGG